MQLNRFQRALTLGIAVVVIAGGCSIAAFAHGPGGDGGRGGYRGFLGGFGGPGPRTPSAVYDSTIALSNYQYSQAFNGYEMSEFGNEINLDPSPRLVNVVVAMANFGSTSFSTPITFNIYEPGATPGTAGSLIATDTQTFTIPAASTCTSPSCFIAAGSVAVSNVTFKNWGFSTVLPSTVVYGISLDALNSDCATTPSDCGNDPNPVGSLNVDLSSSGTDITAGSDALPGNVFASLGNPSYLACPLNGGSLPLTFPAPKTFESMFVWCGNSSTQYGYGQPDPLGANDIPAVQFNAVGH